MTKKQVLGVKIDDVNLDQAVETVLNWLSKPGKPFDKAQGHGHYIVTPNPEFVMAAQQDPEFKEVLNRADLSIPDGRGLRIGSDIVCTTPGIDLMEELIKRANDLGFTIGFLGGRDQVAKKAAECLQKKYKNLKITYAENGGEVNDYGNVIARSEATWQSHIEQDRHGPASPDLAMTEKCDILFVAFGQVKQEKWIAQNINKIPVKVAMGVGGAFDYLSGQVQRAPKVLRDLGLEWLFRLILQPWRIKRQLNLVKYLWMIWASH